MLNVFVLLVWFSIAFIGINYRRLKSYTFVAFLYITIAIGLNTKTPDYEMYKYIYILSKNPLNYTNTEIGFTYLCNVFNILGFTYEQFRFILAITISILIVQSVKRLGDNLNYVLGMFILFPLVGFISGVRFTLVSAIVCYAIPFLLEGKKGVVKYIVCMIIAISLHMSAVFYCIFVLARKRYKFKQYLYIFIGIFILSLILKNGLIIGIVQNLSNQLIVHKATKWLSQSGGSSPKTLRLIVHIFIVVSYYILSTKMSNRILKTNACAEETNYHKRMILYSNISLYMLLIIPAFTLSTEFQRLMVGILPVYYTIYADYKYNIYVQSKSISRQYRILAFMSVVMYVVFFAITTRENFDFIGALSNNMIFSIIP